MELLSGGELFDNIIKHKHMSEAIARQIFNQMVRAINYCHHNSIVHRDIKPENFILNEVGALNLKLIDFGFAKEFKSSPNSFNTKTGTPYYIAPEILTGK
mmetsp:Transcript_16300/g.35853  ORF Transcript_16300/g.35853 Transcript_16300/m.35853 type:complete len:100 (-) Transcript_16300:750-1049(-)